MSVGDSLLYLLEQEKGKLRTHQVNLHGAALPGIPLFHISFSPDKSLADADRMPYDKPAYTVVHKRPTDRALYGLSKVFERPEYDDLQFRSFLSDIVTISRDSGREITVFQPQPTSVVIKDRTPGEWKALMLQCWKALVDVGIIHMGYVTPANGVPVPTEIGLFTPFTYSHDALNVTITAADLAEHGIPLTYSAKIIHNRMAMEDRVPQVDLDWKAHLAREKESLQELLNLILKDEYWRPRHSNKRDLPKGIQQMQVYARELSPVSVRSAADIATFWSNCRAVVESRPDRKRDAMGTALYNVFREVDIKLGTLTLNANYKRLSKSLECFERNSEAVTKKFDLLKGLVRTDAWKSRHSRKTKAPKCIAQSKDLLIHFDPHKATAQQRNDKLKELQAIAIKRKKAWFVGDKRHALTNTFLDTMSDISDMADLVADTKLESVMAELQGPRQ